MADMKRCSLCKTEKPISSFHRWSRSKDGRRAQCKACKKMMDRDYYRAYESVSSGAKFRSYKPVEPGKSFIEACAKFAAQ
jgi:hypothetical protein